MQPIESRRRKRKDHQKCLHEATPQKKKKIRREENPEIRLQDTCACLLCIRLTHARKIEKEKIRSVRLHLSDSELISNKSHKKEKARKENMMSLVQ